MSEPANAVQTTGAHVVAGVCEGDVLVGKYRIERILGEGGMGVVAQAHHLQLDERVAIKFLLPNALENQEVVARFAREARAAVKIKSEHVARVIAVGEMENGAPYMVMEFLEGQDLQARLETSGALPIENAVEHILQASEAIAEAHALGIVHRDLKPANVFIIRRRDGTESAKVLDFGISKTTGMAGSGPDAAMTSTQSMMGSPLYMSPEQMMSARDVDTRTDIWALGVILYELVAARPPFVAESFPQLCIEIAQQPPPSLRSFRPDAPPELEAVILRCLEKNREQRFHSVADMVAALAPFAPPRARASVKRISRVLASAGISSPDLKQALESMPPPPPTGMDRSAMAVDQSHIRSGVTVGHAWGQQTVGAPNGTTGALVLAGLAAVAVLGGAAVGAGLLLRAPDPEAALAPTSSAVEPGAPESEPVAPSTESLAAVEALPSDTPSASPPSSAAAPAAEATPSPAPRPAPVPVARPAPVTRPLPQPAPVIPAPARVAPRPVRRTAPGDLYGDRK